LWPRDEANVLNKLDETPALIVIDLQKAMLGLPAEPPIQDVVNRTGELARAFRERGLPQQQPRTF
jgi:nicotinamidase-related amidase